MHRYTLRYKWSMTQFWLCVSTVYMPYRQALPACVAIGGPLNHCEIQIELRTRSVLVTGGLSRPWSMSNVYLLCFSKVFEKFCMAPGFLRARQIIFCVPLIGVRIECVAISLVANTHRRGAYVRGIENCKTRDDDYRIQKKSKMKILNEKPKARKPKKQTRMHDFFKGRLFSAANK